MISVAILFFLMSITLFFLYLGFTKKQYFFIILTGILFLFNAFAMTDEILVQSHILNETHENKTASITNVIYEYQHDYLNETIQKSLLTINMLLGLLFILMGLYYFYKNPDLDSGKNNDD